MTLTMAGCFEGIGGFSLGFQRAGMTPIYHCEIDKARRAVLHEHWPDVPQGGDINDVSGTDLGSPDVMAGGFPCKNTSTASPDRSGLSGKYGRLYWEYHRLVEEHLRLVDSARPRWVVIENAAGLLSSNGGRDLGSIGRGLEHLGYGWASRVVDGRYFGTAQRRERLVIVAHRGGDPRPARSVLGDNGAGTETAAAHKVGRPARGPQTVAGSEGPDGVLIWRKSARARAPLADGGYETWVESPYSNTLTPNDAGNAARQTHLILQDGRLRTLTPVEWERLSGFPDNWTASMSRSARYDALGDTFQPPVAEWLGRRLIAVDASLPLLSVVA